MTDVRCFWSCRAAVLVALAASLSCSSSESRETNLPVAEDGDVVAPPNGTADASAGSDGSNAGMPMTCPSVLRGSQLVFIPAGDAAFCIDAHEVKQSEYAAFDTEASAAAPQQPSECAWNDHFRPIVYTMGEGTPPPGYCREGIYDPATRGDYSVSCVDWCDARAYCEWAGKRLCSGLGDLEETLGSTTDPTVSEWQYACTNGGLFPYPYGEDYVAGRCVDASFSLTEPEGSPGSPECRGSLPPYDQLTDLAGSLTEWTSACDEGSQECSVQGGDYGNDAVSCASSGRTFFRATRPTIGFRCCADAIP